MDPDVKKGIYEAVAKEPFARLLNLILFELKRGRSIVEMKYKPDITSYSW